MRAFVALDLPATHVDDLIRLQRGLSFGRSVAEENLHLTLAFLGEVSEAKARDLHEALAGMILPKVRMELAGLDTFGGSPPNVLAARAGGEGLEALHAKVRSALRLSAVPIPRSRFRPHVTIARLARPQTEGEARKLGEFLALNGAFKSAAAPVFSIRLMESLLSQDCPIYEPLAEYDLSR